MRRQLLYSGKAKDLYATEAQGLIVAHYKDQVTMLNGARKEELAGKGRLNNLISGLIFEHLNQAGIDTHFVKLLSETEQLNRQVTIIPLEVVLRNYAAGSFAKRFGLDEGGKLPQPILEFYYKRDELDDPFINDDHVLFLGLSTPEEMAELRTKTLEINRVLTDLFAQIGLTLIDFKLEFGRTVDGQLVLADEVSPDTCRLWDADGRHMDKDVFRRNLGSLTAVYEEVLDKLKGVKN